MWQLKKIALIDSATFFYVSSCLDQMKKMTLDTPQDYRLHLYQWMLNYRELETHKRPMDRLCKSNHETDVQPNSDLGIEGEVINRIERYLTSIMTGMLDPLSILLEEGLLYRLYADDSSLQCYSYLIRYINKLCFKKPYLRVLEIGAETGDTTLPLLRTLARDQRMLFKQYDFIDTSSAFFDHARPLLGEWAGCVRFKTFDIDHDSIDQGFLENSYDLVIATDVLHATSQIRSTFSHIRRFLSLQKNLLRLRLLEPFRSIRWCLVRCQDDGKVRIVKLRLHIKISRLSSALGIADGRTNNRLLFVEQWGKALFCNSFTGIDIVVNDYDGPAHRSAMIVSTAMNGRDKDCFSAEVEIVCRSALEEWYNNFFIDLLAFLKSKGYVSHLTQ